MGFIFLNVVEGFGQKHLRVFVISLQMTSGDMDNNLQGFVSIKLVFSMKQCEYLH